MPRRLLRLVVGTLVLLAVSAVLPVHGGGPDDRQRRQLSVQVALEQGLAYIQKNEFAEAVAVLDKHIAYIDGNRRYLAALREAYRGHVDALEKAGKSDDARRYRSFLEILEAGPKDPAPRTRSGVTLVNQEKEPARPAMPPGFVGRGKVVEEDDPFSDSNSAQKRSRSLIVRADKEFADKQYELAAAHYAQAERLEVGCTDACRERWGYCRLYSIAQNLNRDGVPANAVELQREVAQAMRQAPRLEAFGQKLLERLREGSLGSTPGTGAGAGAGEARVEIKHTPKPGGWNIAETDNFRVLHMLDEATAEKVVRIAEATRVNMARKWFGEDPQTWNPRCDLYIHPTAQGYSKATGAPTGSPGHSTISLDNGRVLSRRVDIRGDDPNYMVGVLPHETTHVVLAGRFGTHHVPRWADEGMAVLSEPRERINLHLRNLGKHQGEGSLFNVGELMKLTEYPEPRRIGAFYAQSVSVVEFLTRKKNAATFTRFVREGLDEGYDQALQRHYGYRSFAELDQEWRAQAMGEVGVASTSQK